MITRIKKYILLPILLLVGGLMQMSSQAAEKSISDSYLSSYSVENNLVSKNSFLHQVNNSTRNVPIQCEIVEQNVNTFTKDLIDNASFHLVGLKNYNTSIFNLLSRRLSLHKPHLIAFSGEALYLAIRVIRL